MKGLKSEALDGRANGRLKNTISRHSDLTEARANIENEFMHSHVAVPSEDSVMESKEWVDDGSKL